MALRISKTRIHIQSLKNLCKRFLTTRPETTKGAVAEPSHNGPHFTFKDSRKGSFRYKVCTDRSSPIDRPLNSNVIYENQYQKQIDLQHLQPSMLPSFYQKDSTEIIRANTTQIGVTKKETTVPSLQASKTYSNIQLPLKMVRLAPPFPEPVKTMDSSKVSDEEKAEIMLKEARSSRLGAVLQPQLPRRNYSSLANKISLQKSCGASAAPLMVKPVAPRVHQTEQVFFSSMKKIDQKILTDKTNILTAPGVGSPNGNLFFSQQQGLGASTSGGPTILNLPLPSQVEMNMMKLPEIIPKVYQPNITRISKTSTESSKILPKVSIAPQRPIGFRIKKLETKRTYASRAGKKKVDDCGRQKCEKVKNTKEKCPKMCLAGCPPPNKNTACHPIVKRVKCTKQEAPYPAYSELCHEDIEEHMTECNMCPWADEHNPNFKPQKKRYHTSATAVRSFGPTLAGASTSLLNYINNGTIVGFAKNKKPCEPPCGNTCADREQKEKERQERRKKKKNKSGKKCAARNTWARLMNQLNFNTALEAKRDDGCHEETDIPQCGPPKEEPKCKKFPFPPSPPIRDEDKCQKKKKKKIVDCPSGCEKVCQPIIVAGTSIVEPMIFDQTFVKFANKKKNDDGPKKRSTRPTGPPEDPCRLKKKGSSERCPDDLLKKRPGARKKQIEDDFMGINADTNL